MSLEAIAALLGHRTMRMTLVYARISDRTVANEYFRVTEAVEASYRNGEPLPATVEGTNRYTIGPTLRAAALQFQAALEATSGLGHPLTTGEMRERRLAELFRPMIPMRYALTTGVVVNADGLANRQQDLMLVDTLSAPVFSAAGDMGVIGRG